MFFDRKSHEFFDLAMRISDFAEVQKDRLYGVWKDFEVRGEDTEWIKSVYVPQVKTAVEKVEKELYYTLRVAENLNSEVFQWGEKENQYHESACEACDADIGYTAEGYFAIRYHDRVFKKLNNKTSRLLRSSTEALLEKFFRKDYPMDMDDSVLCCINLYKKDKGTDNWLDNDNMCFSAILNALTGRVITDDDSDNIDYYSTSVYSEKESSELFLVPKKNFTDFLSKCKTDEFRNCPLYEERPKM